MPTVLSDMTAPEESVAEVYLAGPKEAGSRALLLDFAYVCQTLRATLRHVERCITGDAPRIEYEVVELAAASARMAAAPVRDGRSDPRVARETGRVHRETVRNLQDGRGVDPRLDYDALKAFRQFSSPLKREGTRLSVTGTPLTSDYVANLDRLLEAVAPAEGAVSGIVEQLDVHGRYSFTLYPPAHGQEIKCFFQPKDYDTVHASVRKHVTVYGTLHYGLGKPFPVRVNVRDVETHPHPDDLPDLLDDEDAWASHDGKDSVDTIRSLRNEWQE